jgi:O-antigen/teichoic acid export membrane protein
MLASHIAGYAPANVVPALFSFLSIYVFTRLVSPEEYGAYALVLSLALLSQALFYYWLQVGATRFTALARKEGRLDLLESTTYRLFVRSSAVFTACYALAVVLVPSLHLAKSAIWLGVPLVVARSLTTISQSFNRGELRVLRYNLVECGQSVLSFAVALLLVERCGLAARGILLGLIAGSLIVGAPALEALGRSFVRRRDEEQARVLLRFGLPLTLSYAMNYVLSTSDRLLVQWFLGPAAVGVYSVSYNTMDRALTSVFLAVSLASFPLAVSKLEREGVEAARRQVYLNGTALLALALPACAGLIVVNAPLASVLIGEPFRAQAREIMPWIAAASLLAGFQVHFFDHAFHLGRRTALCAWSLGPAVAVNVVMNVVLLPRIGLMGAVYATVGGYLASLLGSILIGRLVFRIDFPFGPMLRVAGATALMTIALRAVRPPAGFLGLAGLLALGAITYAAASLLFDVAGVRGLVVRHLQRSEAAP